MLETILENTFYVTLLVGLVGLSIILALGSYAVVRMLMRLIKEEFYKD